MKILVTGGCGYVGSVLVPKLMAVGHEVTVVDTMWFGNCLLGTDCTFVEHDIRDGVDCRGFDAVIHLAAVANDPCGDLDPKLTWEVNALATMQLADAAARAGVKHFIYASSGSVYGVRPEAKVTEDLPCVPLSEYNKTKMVAERVVLSYSDRMVVQVLRPATVCGRSPRQRLDVVVNMLTAQAMTKGVITVFGGEQVRPNIHIEDMTDLYLFMLDNPQHVGVFNAGFENLSVNDIAKKVQLFCGGEITVTPSNDNRSYRQCSDKLLAAGWRPCHTVDEAIQNLAWSFEHGYLRDEDAHYNLRSMPR